MRKAIWMTVFIIVAGLSVFLYWRYFYVFGEGVKSGQLNFLVKKGYIFKTYEGKLIQSGFRSKTVGTIQSYEFDFSVVDEKIAMQLMNNSGKDFDLHYKEYFGVLPWRGVSKYVVDSILSMRQP